MNGHLPAHFYVHVPFCASKCAYCDFASVSGASEELAEAVFSAMRTQVMGWERSGLDGVVETVYFGGGTPSLHAGRVVSLLGFMRRNLVIHPAAEITVEANPDSLDDRVAEALAQAGVTRVSVGVQSFDEHELRLLGRIHDSDAACRACRAVVDAGMDLSVDLICAVPGQDKAGWVASLEQAVQTGAGHLSVYPLSIEDGTPLQVAVDGGLVPAPDPDAAADRMMLAEDALKYWGMERYEVANYARAPHLRSRHNTAYWTGRSYAGIGPGAHGMLDVDTARAAQLFDALPGDAFRVRYGNAGDIDSWMTGKGDTLEVLTAAEARREDAMLGMRLVEGITDDLALFSGSVPVLEELAAAGLVEHVDRHWRTTRRGWLLGNEVFERVLLG